MNKQDTFDVVDGGLNKKLDQLASTLDATNKTLEKVTKDLIKAIERQSKQQKRLQIIYLVLTAFIVLSACASAFFAYKSVTIASGQKSLQSVQVILDTMKTIQETFKISQKHAEERETRENNQSIKKEKTEKLEKAPVKQGTPTKDNSSNK